MRNSLDAVPDDDPVCLSKREFRTHLEFVRANAAGHAQSLGLRCQARQGAAAAPIVASCYEQLSAAYERLPLNSCLAQLSRSRGRSCFSTQKA